MKSKQWQKIIDDVTNGRELPPMFEDATGRLSLATDNRRGPHDFFGQQIPDKVIAAINEHRPEIIAFAYWSRIARESQKRINQTVARPQP